MSEGVTTDFLLDGSEIAEEIAGEGVTSYVGPGLISEVSSTARSVCHMDGIGSTHAMSNAGQDVTEYAIYDAYGDGSTMPGFWYAGKFHYYADPTGLDYVRARYYDPAAGRFISRDPVGYRGGLNLYAYVKNNPVRFVDPSGTSRLSTCAAEATCIFAGLFGACTIAMTPVDDACIIGCIISGPGWFACAATCVGVIEASCLVPAIIAASIDFYACMSSKDKCPPTPCLDALHRKR